MFDDMIADMEAIKDLSPIVTELFLRDKNSNFFLAFFSFLVYSFVFKRNVTHDFIMKRSNKRELQQIASNHLSDTEFKDLMKFYKDYAVEPFSFLVNYTTLLSYNPLGFKRNLL